ncbi:hypothetical protein E2C01_049637 [Portunus trituberculatus]|uniref:Uncharacterized protein n=1 Tax=Portunus trituberculatus TaxID=210409 RepID=A0A5B7GEF8_PORTR|nr:hypothetical protein [Portunus trituberculatus]
MTTPERDGGERGASSPDLPAGHNYSYHIPSRSQSPSSHCRSQLSPPHSLQATATLPADRRHILLRCPFLSSACLRSSGILSRHKH